METNWDPLKARASLAKHGVAFEDAELALSDPSGLTRKDPDARGEERFVTVGVDALGRVVVVVYAYRERRRPADLRTPRHPKGGRCFCERNMT